jgi:hypothetical protein
MVEGWASWVVWAARAGWSGGPGWWGMAQGRVGWPRPRRQAGPARTTRAGVVTSFVEYFFENRRWKVKLREAQAG